MKEHGDGPDVLITDIGMPEEDGYTLTSPRTVTGNAAAELRPNSVANFTERTFGSSLICKTHSGSFAGS